MKYKVELGLASEEEFENWKKNNKKKWFYTVLIIIKLLFKITYYYILELWRVPLKRQPLTPAAAAWQTSKERSIRKPRSMRVSRWVRILSSGSNMRIPLAFTRGHPMKIGAAQWKKLVGLETFSLSGNSGTHCLYLNWRTSSSISMTKQYLSSGSLMMILREFPL